MSRTHFSRSPLERRNTARKIRGAIGLEQHTMAELMAFYGLSRAHIYHILEELKTWEDKHTFEDEAAEINALWRSEFLPKIDPADLNPICPEYHSYKWCLCSGRLTLAYAKGEIPTGNALMNGTTREVPIGLCDDMDDSDPLLD